MIRAKEDTKAFLQGLCAAHFGSAALEQAAGVGDSLVVFASAPGRVELAGNHTDHQGGCTISAAIDQRAYALAAPNDSEEIRVFMDGFGEASFCISDLEARSGERGESLSLIRGMAAAYVQSGGALCGFDMVTCSDIPVGRGLSSSAAFEVLIGVSIRTLCDPMAPAKPLDITALALEGVWAEHTYFGKPCGAQDQLASAYGGVIALDFSDEMPLVTPIGFDFSTCPYSIYLIDSRCDHSRFTDEYAAIPTDMQAVAQHFDSTRLEDVSYCEFLGQLPQVRAGLGDRAVLRALHYFEETQRVKAQVRALQAGSFEEFLKMVRLSGASSAQFLQNVSPRSDESGDSQPAMVILALCAQLLESTDLMSSGYHRGAYRIHGGGFGGSVLAFVPKQEADEFRVSMNTLLGYDVCLPISITSQGAHAERLV